MRSLLLMLFVLGSLPYALIHPVVGVYLWVWLSLMNPHRLTYGLAYDLSFAFYAAVVTLVGLLVTKDPKRLPVAPATVALLLFLIWITIGYPLAFFPEYGWDMWNKVMKIQIMTFVAAALIWNRKQIERVVWIIAVSIGYYGIKGGIFTLRTGGIQKVYGPEGTFIEGNNELALAIIMIIPLMWFLVGVTKRRWVRFGLIGAMGLCSLAAIGSYSRGAFLAIAAMSIAIWWKSSRKGWLGVGLIAIWPLILAFMPDAWDQRMSSISNYEQDGSAMGRINAWWMAWNLAVAHPFFGGGFEIYNYPIFAMYAPIPADVHAAHSIYFQVLGEHGFVGLFLFLLMWWYTWRSAVWILKHANKKGENSWAYHLAAMCQVSLIGYFVGGAFLSLAYFDLPYYIMVALVTTKWLLEREAGVTYATPSALAPMAAGHPAIASRSNAGTP